jgi:hypothetical protein
MFTTFFPHTSHATLGLIPSIFSNSSPSPCSPLELEQGDELNLELGEEDEEPDSDLEGWELKDVESLVLGDPFLVGELLPTE